MSYTLSNFLTDVSTRVNNEDGTVTPSKVVTFANESLRRARRKFDLPSAEVISQIPLYTGVYSYALPYAGFKDFLSLQDNYRPNDMVFMRPVSEDVFWSNLQAGNIKSEKRDGTTRTLLFNLMYPATSSLVVNGLLSPTSDGTWVASGDAGSLGTDYLFYRSGNSSLSFNITPSTGTATLTNSTMSPKDLSNIVFQNTGMFTLWIYFPSSTAYTSFSLKYGSSASAYHQASSTTQIDGSAFVQGWNQLGFDWINATTTGTPTDSSTTYLQLNISLPVSVGTQTGLRINELRVNQRRLFNLHSTTNYLVIDGSTGVPKEQFSSSTDTSSYFNLDSEFTDFFLYETLEQIYSILINDPDARNEYRAKRMEAEADLLMRYPSKRQPEVQMYNDTSTIDAWLKR